MKRVTSGSAVVDTLAVVEMLAVVLVVLHASMIFLLRINFVEEKFDKERNNTMSVMEAP